MSHKKPKQFEEARFYASRVTYTKGITDSGSGGKVALWVFAFTFVAVIYLVWQKTSIESTAETLLADQMSTPSISSSAAPAYFTEIEDETTAQVSAESAEAEVTTNDAPLTYTEAVKRYLGSLPINSHINAGARSRIVLDGETYRVGDSVNPEMGLTFEGIHPEQPWALFRDRDGEIRFRPL